MPLSGVPFFSMETGSEDEQKQRSAGANSFASEECVRKRMDFVYACPGLTECRSAGGLVLSLSSLEVILAPWKTVPHLVNLAQRGNFPSSLSCQEVERGLRNDAHLGICIWKGNQPAQFWIVLGYNEHCCWKH